MKENKLNFTKESIDILNYIIENMENKTFHKHYHILYDLCNNLGYENQTYLEIGAFAGGSASLVSSNNNVINAYSIDLGQPIDKEIAISNVNKFKNKNCKYEYIQGSSYDEKIVNYVKSKVDKIDILFIDGDHGYDAVINDFNNYKDLVVSNGYIVFDDYMDFEFSPQVKPAVDDLVKGLNPNEYEVIGSLNYENYYLVESNLKSNNEFILRKK
jgi:cephalosporin hydroxylase